MIAQVRIARPTNKLKEVITFYTVGIGLTQLGFFENHNGYDGVMLGIPGKEYHLEFTQHQAGSPCPAPTRDNLLVFYMPEVGARTATANRLEQLGYRPVPPENPYWLDKAVTFADPDGWRVVLFDGTWPAG